MKNKFKDQCDICGNFDFCKGVNGQVICPKCASETEVIDTFKLVGEINNDDGTEIQIASRNHRRNA